MKALSNKVERILGKCEYGIVYFVIQQQKKRDKAQLGNAELRETCGEASVLTAMRGVLVKPYIGACVLL
jgi:uncharacterized protein YutD